MQCLSEMKKKVVLAASDYLAGFGNGTQGYYVCRSAQLLPSDRITRILLPSSQPLADIPTAPAHTFVVCIDSPEDEANEENAPGSASSSRPPITVISDGGGRDLVSGANAAVSSPFPQGSECSPIFELSEAATNPAADVPSSNTGNFRRRSEGYTGQQDSEEPQPKKKEKRVWTPTDKFVQMVFTCSDLLIPAVH